MNFFFFFYLKTYFLNKLGRIANSLKPIILNISMHFNQYRTLITIFHIHICTY